MALTVNEIYAIVIMLIALVGIVAIVIMSKKTSEAFSKVKKAQIISGAYAKFDADREKPKENFVGGRSFMITNGQFDYLAPASEKKDAQHSATEAEKKEVAMDLANQIATEVAATTTEVAPTIPAETTSPQYDTAGSVSTGMDIVSGDGKVVTHEGFGRGRAFANFDVITSDTNRVSSSIAQSEEPSQKTPDMVAFEKKMN